MLTIYHNPRCSKSRRAVQLAQAANAEIDVIEYLKHPLDATQLAQIIVWLGGDARLLMRKSEAIYKELKLDDVQAQNTLIAAMAAHPILMERPLVVSDNRALIARPPELIAQFL